MATIRVSDSVRVALLGAGVISPDHALSLKALPGIDLVAVCDPMLARAQDLANQFAIPKAYAVPAEMLEKERPDVVHVLTPPQVHQPAALECLRAGSDVFVEKPLGVSTAECVELRDTAARLGRRIGVNHQLTYTQAFRQLCDAIRQRRLGRLNHINVSFCMRAEHLPTRDANHFVFRSTGNCVFEYAPHPFSAIRRLMGKVKSVRSVRSGEVAVSAGRSYHHSWQVAMECERGTAQLFLSLGRGVQDETVHVLGEDGTAIADIMRGHFHLYESTPSVLTADAQSAIANARRNLAESVGGIWNHYAVKTRLRPYSSRNPFWSSLAAFYAARAAGHPAEEGADAGTAVVEYCEQTVRASGA
jgi:predicted dehydrogenase